MSHHAPKHQTTPNLHTANPARIDRSLVGTHYSLTCINNGTDTRAFCVFQVAGSASNPLITAWFAKQAAPGTKVDFGWNIDYSLQWDQTGLLNGQVTFDATQSVEVDVSQGSIQKFGMVNNAYQFEGPAPNGNPGTVACITDGSVQNNQVSIALAMSGSAVAAVQAEPNFNVSFTPKPTYYLVWGSFIQGAIVDVSLISQAQKLDYQGQGTFHFTASIDGFNNWTLSPN